MAHVTALIPVDTIEFFKIAFQQSGFFAFEIAAAVGNAEGEAMAVIIVGGGGGEADGGEQGLRGAVGGDGAAA